MRIVGLSVLALALAISSTLGNAQETAAREDPKPKPTPAPITAPSYPAAQNAFKALEARCATCHQASRLGPGRTPGAFANVLRLDQVANDPDLVLPGNPHGSRLFTGPAKQQGAHAALASDSGDPQQLSADLLAIHDWIEGLSPSSAAGCVGRDLIDRRAVLSAIAADVDAQLGRRRKGMRYLTLTHLHNACADEIAMDRFRQGAVKLLNSLSRGSAPSQLRTVDEAKTVIAFNLDDLGWSPEDWNRLIASYAYGVRPDTTLYDTVVAQTETPLPWLRADWFAYTASRAPLYYRLLKLPVSQAELEKQLKIDIAQNIEKLEAARAGLQDSAQSKRNRLIERHSLDNGYLWLAYDFAADGPEKRLSERPLGPGGANGFQHDEIQSLFSLPNGFVAYFLSNKDGKRRNSGSPEILRQPGPSNDRVRAAISCLGCHAGGVQGAGGEIKRVQFANTDISPDMREKIEALYKPAEEMDKLAEQDGERFAAAMRQAGLDPELDAPSWGLETIAFLSRQYAKAIGLSQLAAEFGVAPATLAEALQEAGGIRIGLKRRLEQGAVPRRLVEAQFLDLAAIVSDDETIQLEAEDVDASDDRASGPQPERLDFDFALISDKSEYKTGETPVLTISSERDCYLTLTRVDPKGEATVIFPNKSQRDNFLLEGTLVQFPPKKNPNLFRLRAKGKESVIARCNAEGAELSGGEDAFKRLRRAALGDYREVVTREIDAEAKTSEGRGSDDETAPNPPPAMASTAITFDVE